MQSNNVMPALVSSLEGGDITVPRHSASGNLNLEFSRCSGRASGGVARMEGVKRWSI